ncbi:MAG: hypothetical protein GY820_44540, partial [Gammaproteobacteria bacterium]|nr:hypothetical protein [Gammaproteobacteria bacterium]
EDRAGLFASTILSGDYLGDDDPDDLTINKTDNASTVVQALGAIRAELTGFGLDGFIVSGGNGGSGMRMVFTDAATLTNITFSGNSAIKGGGMYMSDSDAATLTNITFSGNSAGASGGGMYMRNTDAATLTNITFSGNSAVTNGGGMRMASSDAATLTNITFSGNSAVTNGGGMRMA